MTFFYSFICAAQCEKWINKRNDKRIRNPIITGLTLNCHHLPSIEWIVYMHRNSCIYYNTIVVPTFEQPVAVNNKCHLYNFAPIGAALWPRQYSRMLM